MKRRVIWFALSRCGPALLLWPAAPAVAQRPPPPADSTAALSDGDPDALEKTMWTVRSVAQDLRGPDYGYDGKLSQDLASLAEISASILAIKRHIRTIDEPWRANADEALDRATAGFRDKDIDAVDRAMARFDALREPWSSARGNAWVEAVEVRAKIADFKQEHDRAEALRLSAADETRLSNYARWLRLTDAAVARSKVGEVERDKAAVQRGLHLLRLALPLTPRHRSPLLWASTQSAIGDALYNLDRVQGGTAHLEEAIAAYRLALLEYKRASDPAAAWIALHINIGQSLEALGKTAQSPARLREAIASYQLAIRRRGRTPDIRYWPTIDAGLARALFTLGTLQDSKARLRESVDRYRLALGEMRRDRTPLFWARTQSDLGYSLQELGLREKETGHLDESVTAFGLALEEATRERAPLDWVSTRVGRAYSRTIMYERSGDKYLITEADREVREACQPTITVHAPSLIRACVNTMQRIIKAKAAPSPSSR
ncbi:hypothetical protein [Sphingomonas sp.]|uniref:hypothetical protein n=1 Tax=Sphingomonas sp. TaxID=28214 RepID=UPI003567BB27